MISFAAYLARLNARAERRFLRKLRSELVRHCECSDIGQLPRDLVVALERVARNPESVRNLLRERMPCDAASKFLLSKLPSFPACLVVIALDGSFDRSVRGCAVDLTTDERDIEKLALQRDDYDIRNRAISRVSSKEVLLALLPEDPVAPGLSAQTGHRRPGRSPVR